MDDIRNNKNGNYVINNNNKNGNNNLVDEFTCYNTLRLLAHIGRPLRNVKHAKMKSRLLRILYANLFVNLYHEDLYMLMTRFYELYGTLERLKNKKLY